MAYLPAPGDLKIKPKKTTPKGSSKVLAESKAGLDAAYWKPSVKPGARFQDISSVKNPPLTFDTKPLPKGTRMANLGHISGQMYQVSGSPSTLVTGDRQRAAKLRKQLMGGLNGELDHIIAHSLGGTDMPENLRPVPTEVNQEGTLTRGLIAVKILLDNPEKAKKFLGREMSLQEARVWNIQMADMAKAETIENQRRDKETLKRIPKPVAGKLVGMDPNSDEAVKMAAETVKAWEKEYKPNFISDVWSAIKGSVGAVFSTKESKEAGDKIGSKITSGSDRIRAVNAGIANDPDANFVSKALAKNAMFWDSMSRKAASALTLGHVPISAAPDAKASDEIAGTIGEIGGSLAAYWAAGHLLGTVGGAAVQAGAAGKLGTIGKIAAKVAGTLGKAPAVSSMPKWVPTGVKLRIAEAVAKLPANILTFGIVGQMRRYEGDTMKDQAAERGHQAAVDAALGTLTSIFRGGLTTKTGKPNAELAGLWMATTGTLTAAGEDAQSAALNATIITAFHALAPDEAYRRIKLHAESTSKAVLERYTGPRDVFTDADVVAAKKEAEIAHRDDPEGLKKAYSQIDAAYEIQRRKLMSQEELDAEIKKKAAEVEESVAKAKKELKAKDEADVNARNKATTEERIKELEAAKAQETQGKLAEAIAPKEVAAKAQANLKLAAKAGALVPTKTGFAPAKGAVIRVKATPVGANVSVVFKGKVHDIGEVLGDFGFKLAGTTRRAVSTSTTTIGQRAPNPDLGPRLGDRLAPAQPKDPARGAAAVSDITPRQADPATGVIKDSTPSGTAAIEANAQAEKGVRQPVDRVERTTVIRNPAASGTAPISAPAARARQIAPAAQPMVAPPAPAGARPPVETPFGSTAGYFPEPGAAVPPKRGMYTIPARMGAISREIQGMFARFSGHIQKENLLEATAKKIEIDAEGISQTSLDLGDPTSNMEQSMKVQVAQEALEADIRSSVREVEIAAKKRESSKKRKADATAGLFSQKIQARRARENTTHIDPNKTTVKEMLNVFSPEEGALSIDIETTGLKDDAGITAVGVHDMYTGDSVVYFQDDVAALVRSNPEATKALSDKNLKAAPISELWGRLAGAKKLVGFNIDAFDMKLLRRDSPVDISGVKTYDIMHDVTGGFGHRMSLESVAKGTLKIGKAGKGSDAIELAKQGKFAELAAYVRDDAELVSALYGVGKETGELKVEMKPGESKTIKSGARPVPQEGVKIEPKPKSKEDAARTTADEKQDILLKLTEELQTEANNMDSHDALATGTSAGEAPGMLESDYQRALSEKLRAIVSKFFGMAEKTQPYRAGSGGNTQVVAPLSKINKAYDFTSSEYKSMLEYADSLAKAKTEELFSAGRTLYKETTAERNSTVKILNKRERVSDLEADANKLQARKRELINEGATQKDIAKVDREIDDLETEIHSTKGALSQSKDSVIKSANKIQTMFESAGATIPKTLGEDLISGKTKTAELRDKAAAVGDYQLVAEVNRLEDTLSQYNEASYESQLPYERRSSDPGAPTEEAYNKFEKDVAHGRTPNTYDAWKAYEAFFAGDTSLAMEHPVLRRRPMFSELAKKAQDIYEKRVLVDNAYTKEVPLKGGEATGEAIKTKELITDMVAAGQIKVVPNEHTPSQLAFLNEVGMSEHVSFLPSPEYEPLFKDEMVMEAFKSHPESEYYKYWGKEGLGDRPFIPDPDAHIKVKNPVVDGLQNWGSKIKNKLLKPALDRIVPKLEESLGKDVVHGTDYRAGDEVPEAFYNYMREGNVDNLTEVEFGLRQMVNAGLVDPELAANPIQKRLLQEYAEWRSNATSDPAKARPLGSDIYFTARPTAEAKKSPNQFFNATNVLNRIKMEQQPIGKFLYATRPSVDELRGVERFLESDPMLPDTDALPERIKELATEAGFLTKSGVADKASWALAIGRTPNAKTSHQAVGAAPTKMSRSTNDEGKIAELLGIPKEHAREILKSPPAEPRKTYSREEEIFGALMEGNKNLREKFEALSDAEKSRAYDRMAEAYAEFLSTPIKKAHTEYQDLKKKHETAQAERKTELQKLEHAAELAKRMERSLTTTNASVVSEARKKVAAASNELRKALGLSPKSHGYVPKPEVYEHRPERKLVLPKGKQDPGKLSDKAYPKAKAELAELQSGAVARAEDIASRIKVAEKKKRAAKLDVEEMIALGDLSENAAYSEAKERLAEADAEINSLIQEASPETLRERINFLKQRIADFEKRK